MYNEEVARVFPVPQSHGAFPFERGIDGPRLKVIEWAVPKVSVPQIQEQSNADSAEHIRTQVFKMAELVT